jgi:hypothetical protein
MQNMEEKLARFHRNNEIPHILFHGNCVVSQQLLNRFLNVIYENNQETMKKNIMYINCCILKGIQYIRTQVNYFAKINMQTNKKLGGVQFKSIVLLHANFLTEDAQSALRRIIEIYSHKTRFFMIVENIHQILKPIVSRFCEFYVEHVFNSWDSIRSSENASPFDFLMDPFLPAVNHHMLVCWTNQLIEKGYSSYDFIEFIKTSLAAATTLQLQILFFKIKSEFRSEKILLFTLLDFYFFQNNSKTSTSFLETCEE